MSRPHSSPSHRALLAPGALLTAVLVLSATCGAASGATAGAVSSLPAADYQPHHVCSAPAPGRASCMALDLLPRAEVAPGAGHAPLGRTLAAHGEETLQALVGPDYAAGQSPTAIEPAYLRSAYGLPSTPVIGSAPQTIALVDAYNDFNAEEDLAKYDSYFRLAACTVANGCFAKLNQNGAAAQGTGGEPPFPKSAKELQERETTCKDGKERRAREAACAEVGEALGWSVEISTDVDVAHSLCQSCHILLVEANSPSYVDLEAAEDVAVQHGATEVSNSWGGPEPTEDSHAFEHRETVITAAAGDDGYLNWTQAESAEGSYSAEADYPASSPHVVAVGGTELTLTAAGARQSETAWNEDPDPEGKNEGAGGGGCSVEFSAPEWQRAVPDWAQVGCGTGAESKRAVADVAADADPFSGVLVYDSEESREYLLVIGGTSVASPIIASVFALAGGANGVAYPAKTLYSHLGSPALHDITEGGNGRCDDLYTGGCSGSMEPLSPLDCGEGVLICNAATGYDGPTGVGTPNGIAAFAPGSEEEQALRAEEAKKRVEEAEAKAAEETRKLEEQRKAEAEAKAAEETRKLEEQRKAEAEAKAAEEAKAITQRIGEEAAHSASNGSGNATGTGGGSQGATLSTSPGGSRSSTANGAKSSSPPAVRLSDLALTARASALIPRGPLTRSQVAFTFLLSAPARVRVALSRQTRVHGRLRWVPVRGAFMLAGERGRNHLHLRGRGTLPGGRYLLTLTPAHGRARSLELRLE